MSKIDSVCDKLGNVFLNFKDCLQLPQTPEVSIIDHKNDGSFIIYLDEKSMPYIKLNKDFILDEIDDSKIFKIKNIKKLAFVPIDGREGLIGFGTSQCDFVFFDEIDFCFAEFKLNAISSEDSAVRKNRGKAINQLLQTISLFDEKLEKNYFGLHLEAYICTPIFYPRLNASWRELSQDFLEEHGIQLFEENEKIAQNA